MTRGDSARTRSLQERKKEEESARLSFRALTKKLRKGKVATITKG
jgi:hypothetical protein